MATHRGDYTEATRVSLYNHYLRPLWLREPDEEYAILRTAAALCDSTGEEVVEVTGPDAQAVLDRALLRDLRPLADNRCLYSAMCYDYGGIADDGILARFSAERFWFVGGEGQSAQWLYGLAVGRRARVRSLLDTVHLLGLHGPRAQRILQSVTDTDLAALPYYGLVPAARVAGVPVVITRTGWTGETGYDLYVQRADGLALYRRLCAAGKADDLQPCGSGALNLRRVEVVVLTYGTDMDWTTDPFEAGLAWMVSWDKGPFRAQRALLHLAQRPPARRVVGLELGGSAPAAERAPVHDRHGPAGAITSAVFSPLLQKSIALALLAQRASEPGTLVSVSTAAGQRPARVVPLPFDPTKRPRGA